MLVNPEISQASEAIRNLTMVMKLPFPDTKNKKR